MKQILIFLLLFTLVVALDVLMDILQGLDINEVIHAFIKIKQKIKSEEIILIILLFLPLIISKSYNFFNRQKEA
ncbi:hypothetical protein KW850_23600 [Bacillus sp. sid0103]|uniref:hypothetical protein n=1 Tax=Bacillus sp. sid0103 TaxID=2856337 RepID=UPI001C47CFA9|nr:hypothetical protein [Bacillus sp. sid0103]MBV7508208.1 hypothetical protein [Bacillus sp. sid0103]